MPSNDTIGLPTDDGSVSIDTIETTTKEYGELEEWDIIVDAEVGFAGLVVADPVREIRGGPEGSAKTIVHVPVLDYSAHELLLNSRSQGAKDPAVAMFRLFSDLAGMINYERGLAEEEVTVVASASRPPLRSTV